MKIRKLKIVFAVCGLSVFWSCGSNTEESNVTDSVLTQTEVKNEKIKVIDAYPIPTPAETGQMLQKAGAAFILELVNPTQNSDKYIVQKDQALNLGVYGADFGYMGTYNKLKETKEYFICMKKLSDNMGITTKYTSKITTELEKNLSNKDSLHNIITNTYFETFNYLNKNNQGDLAFLVLAGGWIESLYITTQLAITASNKTELSKQIASQKKSYNSLILLSEIFNDNQDINYISGKMKILGEILNSTGESINEVQLNELLTQTDKIRNEIIEAK